MKHRPFDYSGMDQKSACLKAINDISRAFHHEMKIKCDSLGMKDSYIRVISYLANNDGASQLDLVRFTGFKPPTISVTLQNMESDGFIDRIPDSEDNRIMRVFLSQKGREFDTSILSEIKLAQEKLLDGVSDSEAEKLNEIFGKIISNITKKEIK